MSAVKHAAHGTVLNIATTPTALTLVISVTPPGRVRQEIDGVALADDFEVPILGIEQKSEVQASQFWHPGDDNHELLDTAFNDKSVLTCQIVTPHAEPVTLEFTAQVSKLEPEELSPGGTFKRKVTFMRTSDITPTTGSGSSP
jgi:hypothetical protein